MDMMRRNDTQVTKRVMINDGETEERCGVYYYIPKDVEYIIIILQIFAWMKRTKTFCADP